MRRNYQGICPLQYRDRETAVMIIVALLLGFIPTAGNILGADEKPRDVKLDIEKVTLFKNGLGFIVSSGEIPDDARVVRFGQLPVPSLGTFWVGYSKGTHIENLETSMEDVEREEPAQSIGQLLQLNVGRAVKVHTSDGTTLEGTVLQAPAGKQTPEPSSPYVMSPRAGPYNPYGPPALTGNILILKTDKGIVALTAGSVDRAVFADGEPVGTTRVKQKCPAMWMNLEQPAGGQKVTVSYLAHGITWMPGYLIDLSDPKTAKFNAHAVVVNELADLDNVKVQLVTGFPNIKFAEVLSPMAKSQTLAEFLGALSGAGGRGQTAGGLMTQRAVTVNALEGYVRDEALVPGYTTATEGMAAEDLYFYPVKDMTLKKDETAWIPLFSAEMPYKHIYTWAIKDFIDADDHYRTEQEPQERKPGEEVWHSCRLTSTLTMPLTTAATEFVTNSEFTGQDICYYTPPRGETTIRINKALNIIADQGEIEIERKRGAAEFHGYRYDLVKVKGELKIRSKLDKQVTMEITKELSGDVLESMPKSKDIKTAKGLKQVNPKHILTWIVELKPNEEQNILYQYQVYIRD